MLDLLLIPFAMYGLTFFFLDSSIFAPIRIFLISKSVFLYKLFSCYFCSGFHVGWILYLLHNSFITWKVSNFIIWGFAGASISFIFDLIVSYLSIKLEILKTELK